MKVTECTNTTLGISFEDYSLLFTAHNDASLSIRLVDRQERVVDCVCLDFGTVAAYMEDQPSLLKRMILSKLTVSVATHSVSYGDMKQADDEDTARACLYLITKWIDARLAGL